MEIEKKEEEEVKKKEVEKEKEKKQKKYHSQTSLPAFKDQIHLRHSLLLLISLGSI